MPSIAWWIGSITFSTSFEQWVGTKVYWLSSLGQVLFIHFPFNLCTTPIQICSPPLSTHSVSPEAELLRQRQPALSSSSFPWGLANGGHQEEGTHRGERCLFPIFYWRAPPPLGRPPHSLSVSRFCPQTKVRWQPSCSSSQAYSRRTTLSAVVILNLIHTFVNSSFIKLSSNYPIECVICFLPGPLTDKRPKEIRSNSPKFKSS